MKKTTKPLTPVQIRALEVVRDHGPLLSSCAGEKIWPVNKFKNNQGAGFAGGCLLGKLSKRGLVTTKYHDRPHHNGDLWLAGWILTPAGRKALKA